MSDAAEIIQALPASDQRVLIHAVGDAFRDPAGWEWLAYWNALSNFGRRVLLNRRFDAGVILEGALELWTGAARTGFKRLMRAAAAASLDESTRARIVRRIESARINEAGQRSTVDGQRSTTADTIDVEVA